MMYIYFIYIYIYIHIHIIYTCDIYVQVALSSMYPLLRRDNISMYICITRLECLLSHASIYIGGAEQHVSAAAARQAHIHHMYI